MRAVSDALPDPAAAPRTRSQRRARAAGAGIPPLGGTPVVRPPVVRPLVPLAVVAFCALLVLGALAGVPFAAAAVALGAGVLTWGWAGLLGLPSPRGTAFVLGVGTVATVLTGALTTGDPFLRWMPAALAVSMVAAFLHQLLRRDGRPRLVESVASVITALALVVSGACLVPLPRTVEGAAVMAVAGAALGVSALVDLLARVPRLRPWLLPLALVAGTGAAVAVAALVGGMTLGAAALLGLLGAAVSAALRAVLGALPTMSGSRSQLACACASVLGCGVVVYVVGRLLVG
jgi:hypothetical protein